MNLTHKISINAVAIEKYITNPNISLIVVINGPDAIAGSNLSLLIINGTIKPTAVEIVKVHKIDTPTMSANTQFP